MSLLDPRDWRVYGNDLVKDSPLYVRSDADRKLRREQGVAGSYQHIVTDHGNLVSNEAFVGMIENLGDAYEMTEEMYGMIWWLATLSPREFDDYASGPDIVEAARQNYKVGLEKAKEANRGRQS